jgi:hypothetical protein
MIRLANLVICFLLITFCCAHSAFTQNTASIGEAKAVKEGIQWEISVDFNTDFDPRRFAQGVFTIVDVETGRKLSLAERPSQEEGFVTILLSTNEDLDCKKPYIIYISGLIFPGKPDTKELFTRLKVIDFRRCPPDPSARQTTGRSESNYKLSKVESGQREDADIYISGQLTGARKKQVQYTADIKIEPNLKGTTGLRVVKYGPSFELLASTVSDADPDSLKLGFYFSYFPWTKNSRDNPQAVPIKWKNTFTLESDRDFRNTNYLWDTRFTFVKSRFGTSKRCSVGPCFYFRPFIGQELGVNIKSPVSEARRKPIYRPYFGATLSSVIPIKRSIEEIIFDVSYIRRFPLTREVTFSEDDDGNLNAVRFGRSPKDLVKSNFQFIFNEFWGAKITYEYGSTPPLYKLVDHKFGVGLIFLGEVKAR